MRAFCCFYLYRYTYFTYDLLVIAGGVVQSIISINSKTVTCGFIQISCCDRSSCINSDAGHEFNNSVWGYVRTFGKLNGNYGKCVGTA